MGGLVVLFFHHRGTETQRGDGKRKAGEKEREKKRGEGQRQEYGAGEGRGCLALNPFFCFSF